MLRLQNRDFIRIGYDVELPLIGSIAFGIIDRGTNILQVRANSYCPLNCIFCSTDAGPNSRWRRCEYRVDKDLLVSWVKEVVKFKKKDVEIHLDSVGEPLMYDKLPDLIQELKSIPNVKVVSIQTHGSLLSYKYAERLTSAGLDRINLSIDTLDQEKAKYLQGAEWYNVKRIMEITEWILRNTNTDILLAPVLLHGINDTDVEDVIKWGKSIGVGKRFPGFGIQVFMKHKHGRIPKDVKIINMKKFEKILLLWEKKYNVKLRLSEEDFGIKKLPMIPTIFKEGEKVKVKIVAPGWLKNEWLAVPVGKEESRVITVIGKELDIESKINVRIIKNKHNIYLARPL
ncbi:MAG: radical SAM protein [Sulfolobaceae archaeon]